MTRFLERPVGLRRSRGFSHFAGFLFPEFRRRYSRHTLAVTNCSSGCSATGCTRRCRRDCGRFVCGVKFGSRIQVFSSGVGTGTILLIVLGGLFYGRYTPNDWPTSIVVVPTGSPVVGAVLTGMVPAMSSPTDADDLWGPRLGDRRGREGCSASDYFWAVVGDDALPAGECRVLSCFVIFSRGAIRRVASRCCATGFRNRAGAAALSRSRWRFRRWARCTS